jgi:hypothetical protein
MLDIKLNTFLTQKSWGVSKISVWTDTFCNVRNIAVFLSCLEMENGISNLVSIQRAILSILLLWRTRHSLLSLCKVRWLRSFVISLCYMPQHEALLVNSFLFSSWYNVTEFVDYVSCTFKREPDTCHVTWKLSKVLSCSTGFQSYSEHKRCPPVFCVFPLWYIGHMRVLVSSGSHIPFLRYAFIWRKTGLESCCSSGHKNKKKITIDNERDIYNSFR